MIDKVLSAILKPHYLSVVKYIGAGVALTISAMTIISKIKSEFSAYEYRSELRQKASDSIQNANYERLFVKIINKLEDLDSSTNKNLGYSRELIEAKKENFRLFKENMQLKSLSEKKTFYLDYSISNLSPAELTVLQNIDLKE